MRIFLSTGLAEPRTMVRHIMRSREKNLEDLELIQDDRALLVQEAKARKILFPDQIFLEEIA